jgi:3',5'-nucleoside bisphosphate phosphatase
LADIDLHTHSTASDGLLAPAVLMAAAAAAGVRVLALTDHDTTDRRGRRRAAARDDPRAGCRDLV